MGNVKFIEFINQSHKNTHTMTQSEINNEITTTRTRNGFYHEIRMEDTKWFVNIDQFNPTQESIFIENEMGEVFERQGTTKIVFVKFIQGL